MSNTTLRTTRTLFQLPNEYTWFENVAVRPSGGILATRLDVPELWEINPDTGAAGCILTFPAPIKSLTGITELAPDTWAIGAGIYDLATVSPVAGSWEIWTVSLGVGGGDVASTLKCVARVPDAELVNGLTTWDEHTVLAVDSGGAVYKVEVSTGAVSKAFSGAAFEAAPGSPLPIGVNGIKLRDGFLYFTNSSRAGLSRIAVDEGVAKAGAEPEVVAQGFPCDDFAFDDGGVAYLCTNPGNTILRVDTNAKAFTTAAGKTESLEVGGPTACALGRREMDWRKLYVVTAGALAAPVNGATEPAKVVVVDLD